MNDYIPTISEEERARRHAARAAARKKKQRERRIRRLVHLLPMMTAVILLAGLLSAWAGSYAKQKDQPQTEDLSLKGVEPEKPELPPVVQTFQPKSGPETVQLGETFPSNHALLIDVEQGLVLAEKDAQAMISPASMTKVLTLLVAAENLTEDDLEKTVTFTREMADYCYVNDCSVVGLMVGETASVRELLYGTILSSGADAALGLADYISGSHPAFVQLMNEKLEELGLSDTAHFTNCVGLYDEDHHCTLYDMAIILKEAMELPICQEVLNARTYDTQPTEAHPEGQTLSNWFLRRIEDKDTGGIEVVAAKTGYVVQSGNCAVSAGRDAQGRLYLCVTADAPGSWRAIYDHVDLYKGFCSSETKA